MAGYTLFLQVAVRLTLAETLGLALLYKLPLARWRLAHYPHCP